MTKESLLKQISDSTQSLKTYGVEQIGLFGSHVRNEATADSDIDFLVEFSEGKKTYDNFMHLSFFF